MELNHSVIQQDETQNLCACEHNNSLYVVSNTQT